VVHLRSTAPVGRLCRGRAQKPQACSDRKVEHRNSWTSRSAPLTGMLPRPVFAAGVRESTASCGRLGSVGEDSTTRAGMWAHAHCMSDVHTQQPVIDVDELS